MSGYTHNMGVFLAEDRVRIFHQSWRVEKPKAVVLVSHGIGEHSGRYGNLMEALEGKNVSFYASDHRGSGMSGGLRGHVDDFSKFYRDLKYFVDNVVRKENKNVPIILIGHSLGGLIAELYALEYPEDITGLILSAPALYSVIPVPFWKKTLAKAVAAFMPKLSMNNEIDPALLSRDTNVVKAYLDDPLTHDLVSAKFYVEYLTYVESAIARTSELAMPLLVIHGTEDKIVSVKSSEYVYETASSEDKQQKIFEGLFHETMNEKVAEREKVLSILSDWILKKAAK